MSDRTTEFSLAFTHVLKGVARFTRAKPVSSRKGLAQSFRSDEGHRRTLLMQQLYHDYAVEVAGVDGDLAYRETLPPDAWMNDRLAAMGERWRVHNVDGFRCEIYEAA